MEVSIYDLGLFESTSVRLEGIDTVVFWRVVRVPGGWIMQDGHSSTYVPHLEQLSLSLRAGQAPSPATQEDRQAERVELEALRSIVGRLQQEIMRFGSGAPGKMYKAVQVEKILSEILSPS